mmetsp:Transcript_96696/g.276069  ORF Transcript_96696/g.276069 Transcript_96696/m.276069 type:complete len:87 (-) Transcript_96696:138-398(-)
MCVLRSLSLTKPLITAHPSSALVQDEWMPTLIRKQISTVLGERMQTQMADKGLDVQIEVVPESQEAPYFFSLVRAEKQVEAGEWKI